MRILIPVSKSERDLHIIYQWVVRTALASVLVFALALMTSILFQQDDSFFQSPLMAALAFSLVVAVAAWQANVFLVAKAMRRFCDGNNELPCCIDLTNCGTAPLPVTDRKDGPAKPQD